MLDVTYISLSRCHRIGQQAKVRCLYIIAKGTLDEVLFLLIKKKFRDLGEFVEGKEEMDIVINKSYRDEKEAMKSICMVDCNNDDDLDFKDNIEESDAFETLINEDIFQHEIEELGEEQAGIRPDDDDDENGDNKLSMIGQMNTSNSKPNTSKDTKKEEIIEDAGSSQQHAICLSDDEGETPDEPQTMSDILEAVDAKEGIIPYIPGRTKIPDSKMYCMFFNESSYGFLASPISGRIVITASDQTNKEIATGDFVFSVNDTTFPLGIKNGIIFMRHAISKPPVKVCFVRNKHFSIWFKEWTASRMAKKKEPNKQSERNSSEIETIEILDD